MRAHTFLVPALLASFSVSCGHESPTQPSADRAARLSALSASAATKTSGLDVLWPNEDGRHWEYSVLSGQCNEPTPPIYAQPADVPAAPRPGDVIQFLAGDRPGPPLKSSGPGIPCIAITGTYHLRFDGFATTLSGVTGQNLLESFAPADRPTPAGSISNRFLMRLAQARPDLAPRIDRREQQPLDFALPLFLRGGVWEKTSDHIGLYGDLDQTLAWEFLGADVKPGSTFDLQLVPSLASDVFLHGLVVERKDSARLRGVSRELEVVYVVDYGLLPVVGSAPADTIGYVRPVDYASVIYVPGVGPVKDFERRGGFAGDITSTPQIVDVRLLEPGSPVLAVRE